MSRDELKAQLAAKREELRRVEEAFSEAAFRRLEWEGPGPLGIYSARIGEDRYTVAETTLQD